VSSTPGRTQMLNQFELPNGATVVDLPGYGYAAVPHRVRSTWGPMIERYLVEREPLVMLFVLVDGEIGPTTLDVQMLEWVRAEHVPHTVVATKLDKVRSSIRQTRKRDLAAACDLERGDVIWVSASKGHGIDELRGLVAAHLRS
jgi:GTP-binding protein